MANERAAKAAKRKGKKKSTNPTDEETHVTIKSLWTAIDIDIVRTEMGVLGEMPNELRIP